MTLLFFNCYLWIISLVFDISAAGLEKQLYRLPVTAHENRGQKSAAHPVWANEDRLAAYYDTVASPFVAGKKLQGGG